MKRIFVGPLWGNRLSTSQLKTLSGPSLSPSFYGGYNFFGTDGSCLIDDLKKFKHENPNARFNLSRFDEHFLTTAGIREEQNYCFRRWFNPFSGILSAIETYAIDPIELFRDPENIHEKLQKQLRERGHLDFFKELKSSLIPQHIDEKIENSIINRTAFDGVTIYNETGGVVTHFLFEEKLIEGYKKKTLALIDQYSYDDK